LNWCFYGGKCTKLFLIAVYFASILKNKSGKTKELILRISALLLILQGYALRALQMTFGDFAWCWKFEQTILIFFKSH
jgi:hypothetical protein